MAAHQHKIEDAAAAFTSCPARTLPSWRMAAILLLGIPFYLFVHEIVPHFFCFGQNGAALLPVPAAYISEVRYVSNHFFIPYGYVAGGLVGYMYIVSLIDQFVECSTHRNDVIIGVWTEDNHPLGIG